MKTKDGSMIASGTIRSTQLTDKEIPDLSSLKEQREIITKEDIYADLLVRGYDYGEYYNLISGLSSSCSNGTLTWNKDWPLLLEGLFQVHMFSNGRKNILMPYSIQKIVMDMSQFTKEMNKGCKFFLLISVTLLFLISITNFYTNVIFFMYYELYFLQHYQ